MNEEIIISGNRDLTRNALWIPYELCDEEADRLMNIWADALLSRLRWAGYKIPGDTIRIDRESTDLHRKYAHYERRDLVAWRGANSKLINNVIDEARAEFDLAIFECARDIARAYMDDGEYGDALEVAHAFRIEPEALGVPRPGRSVAVSS